MSRGYIVVALALGACADAPGPSDEPAPSAAPVALLGPENIDPADSGAQYAWAENGGWVNAEPKPPSGASPGVYVTHGGLTGYMWLENLGWLSLSCENTDSCATAAYGIVNDGGGNLSGRAWGENIGWVDFAPSIGGVPVPSTGVVIDPTTGIFDGTAWGENVGWVNFTFSPALSAHQIATAWRACAPPSCDDLDPCTIDACEPTGCAHAPVENGTSCANGTVCDGAETCQAGTCTAGPPLDCDDDNECTADACDAVSGCVHTPTTCAAACSYDAASGTITVTMSGVASTLSIASGNILLGGAVCAPLSETDSIMVNGTGELTIVGDYVPGRTAEPTGASEIEFTINNDIIVFDADAGNDTVTIVPTGADLNTDGDQDVTMSGAQSSISYRGGAGNDTLDASAYTGTIVLFGGPGADHLVGGAGDDALYGQGNADTLEGNLGKDELYGGPGNDVERGGGAADTFRQDASANGADTLDGGTGADTVTYGARTTAVAVTLDDGIANDGESGEGDQMISVERATGGAGNDTLVGTAGVNVLRGGDGADQLDGGAGNDTLYGDDGDDLVDGNAGDDKLFGGAGNDTLVGDAAGVDTFTAAAGNDTIVDNADGLVEIVSCGTGTDTAEAAGEDTLTGCENLIPP